MKYSRMIRLGFLLTTVLFSLGACRQPVLNEALNTLNFSISQQNIVFRVGTSFGECIGYCRTEMRVNGTALEFKEFAWDFSRQHAPDRFYSDSVAVEEWNRLVDAFDWQAFAALDSVIGCPDCADGGAEWFEVEYFGKIKKVTIEYGADIEKLSLFLEQIRSMRQRIQDRIRNGNKAPRVILTNQPPDSLHHAPFTVRAAAIEGDILAAEVSHSGGCREHFYTLFMAPPTFMESFPVQANLYLVQRDNDDPCDAIIQHTRTFDVRPVAEAYFKAYNRLDQINLNIHWLENSGEVKSIQVGYHPQ